MHESFLFFINLFSVLFQVFDTKTALSIHVGRIHKGDSKEKSYQCTTCFKTFHNSSYLSQHMKIHSGDKPYVCSKPGCNKRFIQLSHKQQHERTHTGRFTLIEWAKCEQFSEKQSSCTLFWSDVWVICFLCLQKMTSLERHFGLFLQERSLTLASILVVRKALASSQTYRVTQGLIFQTVCTSKCSCIFTYSLLPCGMIDENLRMVDPKAVILAPGMNTCLFSAQTEEWEKIGGSNLYSMISFNSCKSIFHITRINQMLHNFL